MTAPRVPGFSIDEELKNKLLFTLLAIFIYRVGAHIASPTVDVLALQQAIQGSAAAGLFQLYDALGGGLTQATILALGIMPYISASIVFQLAAGVVPTISKMQKDEDGRKTITQWTRYLTVAISLAQAYTFSLFVEGLGAVRDPGFVSRMIMVVILTAGAIFVMWLGEQITERGIGNGMSLLITVSILERLWPGSLQLIEFVRTGTISFPTAVLFLAVLLGMVAAVVAMTLAVRRIPIQIPRKVMGRGRIREGQKTFIPVRLITAGVMPIIFAQTVIIVPSTIANFAQTDFLRGIAGFLLPGSAAYNILFALLIVVFSYFYTSIIFNSVDLAENLKKQGAFIPGVKPGAATADYIDNVLGRITLPGSLFLALVAIIPIVVATMLSIPSFQFGGTSILIVVGVLLDTIGQIEQHRTLRKYDGFMKAGRVKSRGGRQSRFGM
ncbi:MAG: preprotein translocase subunit SecY [Gemmatimonadetes bacterium]|nr:preprotein translocase subunit SecY [Gemmatimonadota bacterium]HPF62905.1 preprotein translocase subunit SecY [Gemmatimonadales bacterium]HRX19771.1 preprotein translocase subunit SecY [Gemmatimonadales bacterium]